MKTSATELTKADSVRVGTTIRRLRESKGILQDELADRIGKTASTVSRIEAGLHLIDCHTLFAIAEALGISPMRLVWDSNRELWSTKPWLKKIDGEMEAVLMKLDKAFQE